MASKFKAPRRTDDEQWRKVELLYEHGFRFESLYACHENGSAIAVRYPASYEEALEFVRRYRPGARPSTKKRDKHDPPIGAAAIFLRPARKRDRVLRRLRSGAG